MNLRPAKHIDFALKADWDILFPFELKRILDTAELVLSNKDEETIFNLNFNIECYSGLRVKH